MTVIVNGAPQDLSPDSLVADAVARFGPERSDTGVAVAVNGEVVPKAEWASRSLADGDRVEVLVAIGGG